MIHPSDFIARLDLEFGGHHMFLELHIMDRAGSGCVRHAGTPRHEQHRRAEENSISCQHTTPVLC